MLYFRRPSIVHEEKQLPAEINGQGRTDVSFRSTRTRCTVRKNLKTVKSFGVDYIAVAGHKIRYSPASFPN